MKKEREICASFTDTPEAAIVPAIVCDKCLVKKENALNLWVEDMNRKCVAPEHKDFSKGPLKRVTPSHLLQSGMAA